MVKTIFKTISSSTLGSMMLPFSCRQLWITAFPALAGVTVAIGGLGAGGSLWQAGAAGLATGMTGYVASALSGSEAKAKIQLLEHLKNRQKQNEITPSDLQQLQNELASLRAALEDWAKVQQNGKAAAKTHENAHSQAQTAQLHFEEIETQIQSQKERLSQLRAEEQSLKASIGDLQAKKQKLIQSLKEGIAKVEQLQSKQNLLKQDIARLTQADPSTAAGNFAERPSVPKKGSPDVSLNLARTTKAAADIAWADKYNEVFATLEEKISNLEDGAKAMAELASMKGNSSW
jgi:DNA repair exonuclease SbcCD ATPase subunit